MSSSKKAIFFTACASVVLLVLTYLVTVNIEAGFITINSIWLSNTFFLAFFGGAFASMVVVLLCEIQKFNTQKRATENYMFNHASILYQCLFQLQQNIIDFQTHPNEEIIKGFEGGLIAQAKNEANVLLGVDYTHLSEKNVMSVGYQKFISSLEQIMYPIYQGESAFLISYNLTRMEQIQNSENRAITSADKRICEVLKVQQKNISDAMKHTDTFLQLIDQECKGNYHWMLRKLAMESTYVSIFEAWSLDKYLKA